MYSGENQLMREKKIPRNSDAAFGTTFRNSKCFQRSNQKLYITFFLKQGSLKIETPFAHVTK
jgi:hypothetical protein